MKYTVTIRATYIQELEIEAEDYLAAKVNAIKEYEPDPEALFSIDAFGVEPCAFMDGREDYEYEQQKQKELDDEA